MPLNEFGKVDNDLETTLKTPNDSDIGKILEVEFNYPDGICESHIDGSFGFCEGRNKRKQFKKRGAKTHERLGGILIEK